MEINEQGAVIGNIREMDDLVAFGDELTDDELAMVTGARYRLVYIGKTFYRGDLHPDYQLQPDDED